MESRAQVLTLCPLDSVAATKVAILSSGLLVVGYNDGRVQLWDPRRPAYDIESLILLQQPKLSTHSCLCPVRVCLFV
jgi:hypothetical protein